MAYETKDLLYDPLPDGLERVFLDEEPENLLEDQPPARSGGGIRSDGTLFVDGERLGRVLLVIDCKDYTRPDIAPWWEVVFHPEHHSMSATGRAR